MTASKAGFLDLESDVSPREVQGRTVVLSSSEGIDRTVDLRLAPGAVIAGIVTDSVGGSISAARIDVLQRRSTTAGRRLTHPIALPFGSALTDDRGRYRIFGLAPGEYVIVATPPQNVLTVPVNRAAAALTGLPSAAELDRERSSNRIARTQVSFPSNVDPSVVSPISLTMAQQRIDVNLAIPWVSAVHVRGNVRSSDDLVADNVLVSLIPSDAALPLGVVTTYATTARAGSFELSDVKPGRYWLVAQSGAGRPGTGRQVGSMEIFVGETGLEKVAVLLAPSHSVRVRMSSDDGSPFPSRFVAQAWPLEVPGLSPSEVISSKRNSTGDLEFDGLFPGRYKILLHLQDQEWRLTSVRVGGVVSEEQILQVQTAQGADEVSLVVTKKLGGVRGRMSGGAGRPISDYVALLFPANAGGWMADKVTVTRPDVKGNYDFTRVVAGNYLIAVLVDVEPGVWFDPDFLKSVAGSAVALTVGESRIVEQDIRVGGIH